MEVDIRKDLEGPNIYNFTWIIEEFGHLLSDCTWFNEIRSPVFTANNLDHTSWFLKFGFKIGNDIATYSCDLCRDSEDKGIKKVEINWLVEIVFEGECEQVKKVYESTDIFKKGECFMSETFCTSSDQFKRPVPFKIKCQLRGCLSLRDPICDSCNIQTKTDYFTWIPRGMYHNRKFFGLKGTNFKIRLFSDNGYVKIVVSRLDNYNSCLCYLMCNISLINKNGVMTSKDIGEQRDVFSETSSLETTTFLKVSKIFDPNVKIRVHFFSSVLLETQSVKTQRNSNKSNTFSNSDTFVNLRQDLLRMYESKKEADIKLKIGTELLLAHRCILSTRSPVFSAIFDKNINNHTDILEVENVDVGTMTLLLKFMYTGDSDALNEENAVKLLLAADKYEVDLLKKKCSSYLAMILSVENVCEILHAAVKVQLDCLKTAAMDYVSKHAGSILLTEKWKQLVNLNVHVVSETLSKLSRDFGTYAIKSSSSFKIN